MPKSWDPMASLKGLKLENLQDSDPRAMEALQKIRDAWNNAPIEPSLNGERIRIPGFVIPLEKSGSKVTEFLLVPYFRGLHPYPSASPQPDYPCEGFKTHRKYAYHGYNVGQRPYANPCKRD